MLKSGPMCHSLPAPTDPDVELLVPSLAPYLPVCHHASHNDDNGLNINLQKDKPDTIKCHDHGVSSQQ